ncbi:QRFP-like peptide receptor [Oculina patagonica]
MDLTNTSTRNSSLENSTTDQIVCPAIGDETTSKAIQTTAYCVVLLLSLVGNTLIILVVYQNPRMWTASNYLIVNMAASDLLLPFFAVPRMIVEVLVGRERWLIGGTAGLTLCKLAYFFQDVSTAVSVQSLLAITAERFYVVMFPFKATAMKSKIKYVIPLTWLMAVGLHAPYLQVFKLCLVHGKLYCCQRWSVSLQSKIIYFFLIISLVFGVPLITIVILYAFIVYKLFRQKLPPGARNSITQNQRDQRERQNRNILKMAVTIVVIFFLCFSPLVILALLLTTGSVSIDKCKAEIFRMVAKFFGQSNCALNVFVYYAFNSQFRRGFISNLKRMFFCGGRNNNRINISVRYSTSSQRISLLSEKRNKRGCTAKE